MNKDIKQLAEEMLTRYNNVEWTGEGLPVYSAEQMIAAMVEMYNIGAREASNIELDEARKLRGYFGKNDAGAFYHWAYSLFDTIVKKLEANNVATTPLSSSSGDAPLNSNNSVEQRETIKTWRGLFEVIPFNDYVTEGEYYLVDYNRQSHPAAPDKENEIVKIVSKADYNGYYLTDRGTKVKDYCLIKHLKPISQ